MQQLEQVTMGRYQILQLLARGGMAEIYLARDIETDQVVAVKLVSTGAGDYYERFRDEVKAQAGLSHEHILPVLDHGEFESWCYLVTPYIKHGTLDAHLLRGPLSLAETDHIFGQLCQALQHAHDKGIIHRDIKPSNVLMRDGTHVYLTDFGLVKHIGVNNGLTLTGYLIGTPEYMAPELAEKEAMPASDVYALGVLLYQMLSGRIPFKASTPIGVYVMHIRDMPELPSTYNPAIPIEVEHVIMRALEKDPDRRFASPRDLYLAYAQAVLAADKRRFGLSEVTTQVTYLPREKACVHVVPQKHRILRGRLLCVLLLAPVLLVTVPAMLHVSYSAQGLQFSVTGADAVSPIEKPLTPSVNSKNGKPAATVIVVSPTVTPTPVATTAPKKISPPIATTVPVTNKSVQSAPPTDSSIGEVIKKVKSTKDRGENREKH